ncbi:MAG: hypothetical protein AAGD25_19715 [Cyanobacteria bacterium P01_F01_bin.150]
MGFTVAKTLIMPMPVTRDLHENKLPGALRLSPTRTLRNLVGYLVAAPQRRSLPFVSSIHYSFGLNFQTESSDLCKL